MNREELIFKRLKEHYNFIKDKYEVVGIFIQGSQNYELDIYEKNYISDIDSKAIILPNLEDIVMNIQPISTTLILENNEHIDVKDIRIMFDNFLKQNINFIEILFTKYKILNPKYKEIFQLILNNNERIAHYDFNKSLNCQTGMSHQKWIALKHPYPTIIDKINKFGYDPKQLHHILRMNDFIKKYAINKSYKECLIPDNKNYLIQVKKGILSLNDAEKLANEVDKDTYNISKEYQKENNVLDIEIENLLNNVKSKLITKRINEEILEKNKKQIKIFIPENIFVTSDLHFYHDNILSFENRPFKNINEMNNKLIENWNNTVSNNDLVYILGDFSFGTVSQTEELLKTLNGHKILLIGNHDYFLNSNKFDKNLFDDIKDFLKITIYSKEFIMCHYPLASCISSVINLYGHVHSNDINNLHHSNTIILKSFNVGVDVNNFKPINILDIIKILDK